MVKLSYKFSLWLLITVFVLVVPLKNKVFAYGGGGGGEGGDGGSGSSVSSSLSSAGGPPDSSDYEEEYIDPMFQTPQWAKPVPPHKKDPWSLKKKPDHWPNKKWQEYIKKRSEIWVEQSEEANAGKKRAERNHTIAKGTGYVAAGAGAVVGAIAAPAIAPTILIISVAGDGAATTAGSLAEGKSFKESAKDGVKKAVSTAIFSKLSTGKKGLDAAVGFATGQGYDNANTSSSGMTNTMPPPDTHDMMGRPGWK